MTEFDEDRRLWIPSRRKFFFMGGLAAASTVLEQKAELVAWAFGHTRVGRGLRFLDLPGARELALKMELFRRFEQDYQANADHWIAQRGRLL